MKATEANFDGIVGPTHNYSGLSPGNIASAKHKSLTSNPLEACLQGLQKMKTLTEMGFVQGVLPPHERPDIAALKKRGFNGSDAEILRKAPLSEVAIVSSASSMWTANAATVSPSGDTADGKIHFTPANLISNFHRSLEPATTARILKSIFKDPVHFVHHDPLAADEPLGDEGAANHTRLCKSYGDPGLEFFVYGKAQADQAANIKGPLRFPARQTLEASTAIAKAHRLKSEGVVFARQSPEAIDAGVFHNDVCGVGNQNVYLCHEKAYSDQGVVRKKVETAFRKISGADLKWIEVTEKAVPLAAAVTSYLFNSQLVTSPDGSMILIAPTECRENPKVERQISDFVNSKWIRDVKYFDLRQSMRNGGGPACLRLRVVLNENEASAVNPNCFMNEALFSKLVAWAKKNYRDRLSPEDLADPKLLTESRHALDELTQILGLGSIYPFQQ